MNHFIYKLVPPTSGGSGAGDSDDGDLIAAHDAYLKDQMDKGNVVAFGSVADPNGSYSLAILRLDNEEDAGLVLSADPALAAEAGFEYELLSMPNLTVAG